MRQLAKIQKVEGRQNVHSSIKEHENSADEKESSCKQPK